MLGCAYRTYAYLVLGCCLLCVSWKVPRTRTSRPTAGNTNSQEEDTCHIDELETLRAAVATRDKEMEEARAEIARMKALHEMSSFSAHLIHFFFMKDARIDIKSLRDSLDLSAISAAQEAAITVPVYYADEIWVQISISDLKWPRPRSGCNYRRHFRQFSKVTRKSDLTSFSCSIPVLAANIARLCSNIICEHDPELWSYTLYFTWLKFGKSAKVTGIPMYHMR